MFATERTPSPTWSAYGALLIVIFQHFGIDCPNKPSESSSKPFDKLTVAKSLLQSGCVLPFGILIQNRLKKLMSLVPLLRLVLLPPHFSSIMHHLMCMSTWLDEHIDGSCENLNKMKDWLDEYNEISQASLVFLGCFIDIFTWLLLYLNAFDLIFVTTCPYFNLYGASCTCLFYYIMPLSRCSKHLLVRSLLYIGSFYPIYRGDFWNFYKEIPPYTMTKGEEYRYNKIENIGRLQHWRPIAYIF